MAPQDNYNKNTTLNTLYALSLAWQLGFLIAAPLVGFILIGIWLDHKLNAAPIFLLSGLVTGLLITVHEVYHVLSPLISKKKNYD